MADYKRPGQLIEALLRERSWTKRALAIVLEKDESTINRMISGKGAVTTELALTLEEVFGVAAEEFLDLQKKYDLAVARLSAQPDPTRSARAQLYGDLPVAEMIRRGWIDAKDSRDARAVEDGLAKFFGVSSVDQIEILPHAARKTMVQSEPTPAQLAWLYRVRAITSEMLVPKYSAKTLRTGLDVLRPLMVAAEEARKVPRIMAECGVRFAIVETLPSAKIDGVCMWLGEGSPVIALSLRHDRIDNFWFVLRHEIEHVLQGHGLDVIMLDTELEGERAGTGANIPEEERIANVAAEDFCVPLSQMSAFIDRKAPFFSQRDLIGFSRSLGVHPGIVAGQLQHRTERYDRFRQHLVKIRSCVAPSAMVDGWGDIAPVGQ